MAVRLRVSVVGLFVHPGESPEVLLLHQITPPEPNCWDLPGGGINPEEPLLDGLRREVREETGLVNFDVERVITVVEGFFLEPDGNLLHGINIVYQCSVLPKPMIFNSTDPEVGPWGIRWLPIANLTPGQCSTRAWRSLVAAGYR
ncbi:MAG: NUDIX domain-containing protein [Synechococcales bacterium]|nr:NUDIX domain-containing protein [Synechococcales bacterium]